MKKFIEMMSQSHTLDAALKVAGMFEIVINLVSQIGMSNYITNAIKIVV